jgi:hypothetical protein
VLGAPALNDGATIALRVPADGAGLPAGGPVPGPAWIASAVVQSAVRRRASGTVQMSMERCVRSGIVP